MEGLRGLAVLALIDSTSFGTLLIPMWLLLDPRHIPARRVLVFLAAIAAPYFALGVGLTSAGAAAREGLRAGLEHDAVRIGQLVVGILLVTAGVAMEPWTAAGKARRAAARELRRRNRPTSMEGWRPRALDTGSASALVALAVSAFAVEVVSMVPYLAALGIVVSGGAGAAERTLVIGAYCLLMVLPALILLVLRPLIRWRTARLLSRAELALSRHAREMAAWITSLAGLYLAMDAAASLELIA